MKNLNILFITITLALLISCASTKITSFKDPDYTKADFKRILIVANTNDLEDRQKLENRMVEAFNDAGIYAIESYKLFPPTRELSDEEKVELIIRENIDSFISIDVGESGVTETYVPQTGSTTKTEGEASVYGNKVKYKEKSKTTYQGGYTMSKPWADFETILYDVSNGRMVWIATAHTHGNAYANRNTVIGSYCDSTIDELFEEKLIIKKTTKNN